MPDIVPLQRLISNTSTVYLGVNREQAADNAANMTGSNPIVVPRHPNWPSVEKYMNDTLGAGSPSPFAGVPNPEYIWEGQAQPGQTVSMAIATDEFYSVANADVTIFLAAFADNAMDVKIELFKKNGDFEPLTNQPDGLDDFILVAGEPNNPAAGLTETPPFNWQDVRVYSTDFQIKNCGTYKIVISFEVTNYLTPPNGGSNPAALQFISDIYRVKGYSCHP